MFHSATLKLTGWYLLILMCISMLFSVTIYNAATGEIRNRLSDLQSQFEQPSGYPNPANDPNHRLFTAFNDSQRETANHNLLLTLIIVNLIIFFGGGVLSYLLARRTLRQLEDAHEAQSRFTSDASHELRTPLAVMKSELEVAMMDKQMSKTEMRELLASNLEEVNKLTALSTTLLQLSKLDHANLEMQSVDLNLAATEVVQRYDKNASRVKLKVPKQTLVTKANASSVEELMTIFVDNALKYSPEATPITVTLARQGRSALFTITNSGNGIASDDLPNIFDRFYRSDQSRTTPGTGLGLALAKDIVAMLGGELTVSSAKGKDTTFRFSLPLTK